MALTFNSSIGVFTNWRTFDGKWSFEYTQQYNTDGTPVTDKTKYPAGTIFFDSEVSSFVMSSSVKNVYIDKVPVTVKSSNIQYTSINSIIKDANTDENQTTTDAEGIHRCSIVFESKTPIDPGNLAIKLNSDGPVTLYEVNRKNRSVESNGSIKDISISRNADLYTLTFYVSVDGNPLTDNMLNGLDENNEPIPGKGQIYVTVWNIAGNTVTFNTQFTWKTIINKNDIGDVTPLIITFTDPVPENRIVYPPNEGSIKVIVQNPNSELFDITPTIILEDDSIGVIDDLRYDHDTGIATFYVRPINESGYVVVSAWLAVNNTEIDGALKAKTFATAMDGEWIGATEGRLIRFKQNVPKYLKNDNYASFIQSTEDFFNTVYTSMTNGKHISILEKFARINNFDDIKAMEAPLIDLYRKQYGINVQPNNDDLNFYLRNKQLPPTEPEPESTEGNRRAITEDTDTEVLKNYVFRDITGLELNSFIKDIYKNIPYYNQMAGTYRGIKFILNQIGLCVKLAEVWSTREITDNFEHEETFAREDELNAERYNFTPGQLSDIGRYYLTSRFDVDVMDTGLTFREFNELSYNIVKLVLKVKPIHRVLRKLAFVHVTNTDIHFQDFLLDKLGGSQEVKRYKYTWNLFDTYAAKKTTDDNGVNHTWTITSYVNYTYQYNLRTESIFFPFNTVDAQVKYTWDRYNAYGEDFGCGISDGSTPKNKYADEFLNKHLYIDTPDKKPRFDINNRATINESWPENGNGYVMASKNSYNNLYNIEEKLKRSYCKQIGINFCYLEIERNPYHGNIPTLLCYVNGEAYPVMSDEMINTINPVDLSIRVPVEQDEDDPNSVSYKEVQLIDVFLGKVELPGADLPANAWSQRIFDLGTYANIVSETNGFFLNLMSVAQTVLDEIGVGPYFNKSYVDTNNVSHQPLALFAQIADFKIALGTDYIVYEAGDIPDIESTYTARKYVIIENNSKYTPPVFELSWFAAGNETSYYLLKKGKGGENDRHNRDNWIQVFNKHDPKYKTPEGARYPYYTYIAREGDTIYDRAAISIKNISDPTDPDLIRHVNAVYLDDENWPVVDNLENIELDKNKRPIVIVKSDDEIYYSDTDLAAGKTLSAPITLTEEKECLVGQHFMIVEESKQGNVYTIIYRFSDDYLGYGEINPDNFDLTDADGEFAISYKK